MIAPPCSLHPPFQRTSEIRAACDGYISKPINTRTFCDRVRSHLAAHRARTDRADLKAESHEQVTLGEQLEVQTPVARISREIEAGADTAPAMVSTLANLSKAILNQEILSDMKLE
jgi:DNA-binding response OmpR family regulator